MARSRALRAEFSDATLGGSGGGGREHGGGAGSRGAARFGRLRTEDLQS